MNEDDINMNIYVLRLIPGSARSCGYFLDLAGDTPPADAW